MVLTKQKHIEKIKHILGQKQHDKVGRLLVSELYTVGAGGWSGFPSHKHDTNRIPKETRHDETYNFRFKPNWGSGLQMLQRSDNEPGDANHITLLTAQQFVSITAIILVAFCSLDMKCIISPF